MDLTVKQCESYAVDRSDWPDGPWAAEPDRIVFSHAGLDCIVRRNWAGTWCGYVGVPIGHWAHGKSFDCHMSAMLDAIVGNESERQTLDVHYGPTYCGESFEGVAAFSPEGKLLDFWWIGFDCNHSGDLCPSRSQGIFAVGEVYRDVRFAQVETMSMAKQLCSQSSPKEGQQ